MNEMSWADMNDAMREWAGTTSARPERPSRGHDLALLRACEKMLSTALMYRPVKYYCKVCGVHKSAETRLLQCLGCKVTHYCSIEHQRAHWPLHKEHCIHAKDARADFMAQESLFLSAFRGAINVSALEDIASVEPTRNDPEVMIFDLVFGQMGMNDIPGDGAILESGLVYLGDLIELQTNASMTLALQLASGLYWLSYQGGCRGLPSCIGALYLMLDDLKSFHNFQHWYHRRLFAHNGLTGYIPDTMPNMDPFKSPYVKKSGKWDNMSLITMITFLARLYVKLETAEAIFTAESVLPQEILDMIAENYLRDVDIDIHVNCSECRNQMHLTLAQINRIKRKLHEQQDPCIPTPWHEIVHLCYPHAAGVRLQEFFWSWQDTRVLEVISLAESLPDKPRPLPRTRRRYNKSVSFHRYVF